MVNFNVLPDELKIIRQIAARADRELFGPMRMQQTRMDAEMDLCAVIAQGVPLRLEELLAADAFNFAHDIGGIYLHLDRETGLLQNCFIPRFYRS